MDDTNIRIASQNSTTAAATITAALISQGAPFDAEEFETLRTGILAGQLRLVEDAVAATEAALAAKVQQAFPGAQQVQATAGSVQQVPVPNAYQPPPPPQGPPPNPQQGYAQPQVVPGPPQAGGCPKCNGPVYDNTGDNARRRAPRPDLGAPNGYSLGPDFKCKNRDCGGAVWPSDSYDRKSLPKEPRG